MVPASNSARLPAHTVAIDDDPIKGYTHMTVHTKTPEVHHSFIQYLSSTYLYLHQRKFLLNSTNWSAFYPRCI